MAQQSQNQPSSATLGYLAPICVAVFFIFIWIIVGTRHYFNRDPNRRRRGDPENWPLGSAHVLLTAADLELRFPQMKYSTWSTARRKISRKKEDVDDDDDNEDTADPDAGSLQATTEPTSPLPSTRSSNGPILEKEIGNNTNINNNNNNNNDNDNDNYNYNNPAAAASSNGDPHSLCAICMEYFDDDHSIRSLTCGHIFHATCLDPWFTKRQARCPLCKTCYPPEQAGSVAPIPPPAAIIRNQIFPRVI